MRVRHAKALRRVWRAPPFHEDILAEADLRVTPRSRLRAKLLIFRNPPGMARFWRRISSDALGFGCLGAVNGLAHEVITFRGERELHVMRCDPRYFCIVGLTVRNLTMEIISHEAVHAGFCYAKRQRGDLWKPALDCDEEAVCYPAGRIASAINRFLHREGLFGKTE